MNLFYHSLEDMWDVLLRLTLFLAALAAAVRCVFWGATLLRLGLVLACGLAWVVLSRRKARSIDRDRVGISLHR
ncbi:MAG: hypothetical protein AAB262_08625 [Elusimicrobiota bacterium]